MKKIVTTLMASAFVLGFASAPVMAFDHHEAGEKKAQKECAADDKECVAAHAEKMKGKHKEDGKGKDNHDGDCSEE